MAGVTLELSRDEALVLNDWLYRRERERAGKAADARTTADGSLGAEEIVLAGLHAMLEKALVEIFDPSYESLLANARTRLQQG